MQVRQRYLLTGYMHDKTAAFENILIAYNVIDLFREGQEISYINLFYRFTCSFCLKRMQSA
jgi:hypothetical protein